MEWELYPAKATFAQFAEDWDRLNARLYESHPFFDSRFVGPLLKYFADGKELLCIHRTQGAVSGALILQAEGQGRWTSFRPAQAQATALLLADARLLESLLRTLPGFAWSISLCAIDCRYAPDFTQLELAQITSAHAFTIGIAADISFQDYWEQRSKNLKANVRKYFNRSQKELGSPVVATFTDPAEMDCAVTRFGDLESTGWKGAAGTAVCLANSQKPFYSEVLGLFGLSKQVAIYELHVAERLAASLLVVANEQMAIFLKTTYCESLARFGPGRVLLYRVIEDHLKNHPGKRIEFYTNATRDQTEWTTFGYAIRNIQLFRSDALAAAFALLKVARRSLKGARNRRPSISNDLLSPPVAVRHDFDPPSAQACKQSGSFGNDVLEQSLDWFELLRRTVYPDDPGACYFCVDKQGLPATVLPLRIKSTGRVRTVESLSNYYTSLYTPPSPKDGEMLGLNAIISAATRRHGGAHVMRFAPMDPQAPAFIALQSALREANWIPLRFFCFINWFHRVEGTWEAYLKNRSGNLRSAIKRRSSRFAAAGGTIAIATRPDETEAAIDAFQEIYSASWKRPEPFPDFVPSLIRHLASRGMLRLGIARLGQRTVATQLWIVAQGKASIYKVAYHQDFASYSPGTVLTAHLFRHVIENDHVAEIDFLIGDDKYKKIWMSNCRQRWGIIAYNPRTLIGLALLIREVSWRVVKSVGEKLRGVIAEKRRHLRIFSPKKK